MGSRELRQLNEDNNTWLTRPENQGQTILRERLRSAQRTSGRDRQHPNVSRTRAPPRQIPSARERSRSPITPAPAQDPRPSGASSRESAGPTTPAFHFARPILLTPAPAQDPRPSGASSRESAGPSTPEFHFAWPIPPSRRTREIQPPRRSPIHSGLIQLQRMGTMRPQAIPPPEPRTPAPLGVPHQPPPSSRAAQIGDLRAKTINAEEKQSCVICLTDFIRGEQVTSLPCGHLYHQACIAKWLQNSHRCPLCRRVCF